MEGNTSPETVIKMQVLEEKIENKEAPEPSTPAPAPALAPAPAPDPSPSTTPISLARVPASSHAPSLAPSPTTPVPALYPAPVLVPSPTPPPSPVPVPVPAPAPTKSLAPVTAPASTKSVFVPSPAPTSFPSPSPLPVYSTRNVAGPGIKRIITLALTIFSFILSLPFLFEFAWLLYLRSFNCEGLLYLLKLQSGVIAGLFIVFCVSNVVVYLREKLPAVIGLVLVMIPLTAILIIGLGLVGSFNIETRTVPGSSSWLIQKVHNVDNWQDIKSCLYNSRICKDLASRSFLFGSRDFRSKLTSTESGCCLPPPSCEMEFVNATYWKKQKSSRYSSDSYDQDCDSFRNQDTILCYNCEACKDGFIHPLERKWGNLGIFLIVMSLLLILVHLILFVVSILDKSGG